MQSTTHLPSAMSQDTRHKTQDPRPKTQDTRHKTQYTRHKTQDIQYQKSIWSIRGRYQIDG